MKMNKILVKVYVPMLEEIYDVWIPAHKRIYNVIFNIGDSQQHFDFDFYENQ